LYARGTSGKPTASTDFTGIIQIDGYAAYKKVAGGDGATVTIAHCWAHLI
jgi:transposase